MNEKVLKELNFIKYKEECEKNYMCYKCGEGLERCEWIDFFDGARPYFYSYECPVCSKDLIKKLKEAKIRVDIEYKSWLKEGRNPLVALGRFVKKIFRK